MYDLGIMPDNFNPRVLYVLKSVFGENSVSNYHHHDFLEIKYILSGTGTYRIADETLQVKKGDVIICNPFVAHKKAISGSEPLVEFDIGVDTLHIQDLPPGCLISPEASPLVNLWKYSADFTRCCGELLLEHENDQPGRELLLKALVMKLLVLILKATYTQDSTEEKSGVSFESSDRINIVNTIIDYLNENYMKSISLHKISRNMYLSPAYISKVFKEQTSESPINYLIKIRLARAEEMLKGDTQSIKEIAKSVGYNDVYHFSKLFKKYYNCSPSTFRRQFQKT